ncbi:tumor necrosis factor receptor superfamily member 21 [Latimeria chalumnae]|uniref:tumor necrosis factor receptor superfamily member 21 n=1 Tax=Latimeria chalumnae TaxID=7897 RepID=UPI00313D172F
MGSLKSIAGCFSLVAKASGRMAKDWAMLTLLLLVFGSISAQSNTASNEAGINHHSSVYHHTDHVTGVELTCHKCPAGTYVSEHCTETTLRECSPCPSGTFTLHENGIERCHTCRESCPKDMIEKTPCTALTNRECTCASGFFLAEKTCAPYSVCQIGWGVRKKGSETEDVRCKPCPRGTFSDVPSSVLKCKVYTNCSKQGLVVIKPGTKEQDNLCGPPTTQNFDTTILSTNKPVEHHREVSDATSAATVIPSPTPDRPSEFTKPHVLTRLTPPSTVTRPATKPNDVILPPLSPSVKKEPPQQNPHHHSKHHHSFIPIAKLQPAMEVSGSEKSLGLKPTRRGPPRPNIHKHFDINEHLPWMIVLFLLLVLVVVVVCSIKKSSRVLKRGPRQDPSSIVEKAGLKKPSTPIPNKEKWIYYSNGYGIDILKLVAAQIGSQWKDVYQFLSNATEREVAAFSNGYSADHERAYAALQHWTIRDSDANLAKLISALRGHRRNDVVEKIRGLMEDTAQVIPAVSGNPVSPGGKPFDSSVLTVERSPLEKNKGFFIDESEPLLRCDSTSSGSSNLSRTGSFITKEKKDTVLRQVRLDPCDLQPIFDDMLHILNQEELRVLEEIPQAEDKLDRLFEIAGVKSQEASQKLLDSVYSHLPDLL